MVRREKSFFVMSFILPVFVFLPEVILVINAVFVFCLFLLCIGIEIAAR